eukprot:6194275-Pleurochrysis_carterae.AAC.2
MQTQGSGLAERAPPDQLVHLFWHLSLKSYKSRSSCERPSQRAQPPFSKTDTTIHIISGCWRILHLPSAGKVQTHSG